MYEKKKKQENDRWEEIVKKARNEKDIWKIVNRKKRRIVNEEIEAEEWREYFMELLGGIEYKVRRRWRGKEIGRRNERGENK